MMLKPVFSHLTMKKRHITIPTRIPHSTALYCTLLHSTAFYCILLHSTALYCTLLHFTALYCILLHFTALNCTLLHSPVLSFTLLYSTVLYLYICEGRGVLANTSLSSRELLRAQPKGFPESRSWNFPLLPD